MGLIRRNRPLKQAALVRRAGPLADMVARGWRIQRDPAGLAAAKQGVTVRARCWRSLRNRCMAAELRMTP